MNYVRLCNVSDVALQVIPHVSEYEPVVALNSPFEGDKHLMTGGI